MTLPSTWGDCQAQALGTAANPCPHGRCRHALPAGGCVLAFVDEHPEGATLEAVGAVWGVTRERVRQIEAKALRKLALLPEVER